MYINFYLFIFLAADLCALLFALIYVYSLYEKERKAWKAHNAAVHESEDIVERAHLRATKVVTDAVEKAEKTISQGDYVRTDLMKSFEKSLSELSSTLATNLSHDEKDFEAKFTAFAESLRAEYLKKIDEALSGVEAQAQHEVEQFRADIQKDTISSQSTLAKKVTDEFEQAVQEIAQYKQEQLKLVDSSIENVLQQVARNVLSKSLSLEDHAKLIIESLETAKKEAFFEKGMRVGEGEK